MRLTGSTDLAGNVERCLACEAVVSRGTLDAHAISGSALSRREYLRPSAVGFLGCASF